MADSGDKMIIGVGIDASQADSGGASAQADIKAVETATTSANAAMAQSSQAAAAAQGQATSASTVRAEAERTLGEALRATGMSQTAAATAAKELASAAYTSAQPIAAITTRLEQLGLVGPQALTETNVAMSSFAEGTNAAAAEQEVQTAVTEEQTAALAEAQTAMMRNAFYVHRLAEGFKDLSMGGRLASQGMMDISETMQYMVAPEYAVYIALLQVVGMLVMMSTMHRDGGRAAREHAKDEVEAANEIKEAIDKGTRAMEEMQDAAEKTHLEVVNDQLKDYIANQAAILDQQDRWNANSLKRLGYLQQEAEAHQKLTLAQMENAKQRDLAGAHGQPERDAIEARYKAQELGVRGANADEVYTAKLTALDLERANNDSQRQSLLADNNGLRDQLKALQDDAAAKAHRAQQDGFQPDEAGSFEQSIKGVKEALAKARDDATEASTMNSAETGAAHRIGIGIGSASDRGAISAYNERTRAANQQVQDISGQLADLNAAQEARSALDTGSKELEAAMTKNADAINKLVFALEGIASSRNIADTEHTTEKTQESTEARKDKQEADRKAARDAFDVREAERYARSKAQDAVIDNPNSSEIVKAAAKAAKDQIDAESKRDRLASAGALDLGKAEIVKLLADLGLDQAKAGDAVVAGQNKEQKQSGKVLDDAIRGATKQIEGSGVQQAIQALHAITSAMLDKQTQLAALVELQADVANAKFKSIDQFIAHARTHIRSTKDGITY